MNKSHEEMFDDLHQGVETLREMAQTTSLPLSQKATESLQRLEATVPIARSRFRLWSKNLRDQAIKAAQTTNEIARQHPWIVTLSGLGLGFLFGLLASNCIDKEDEESDS